MPWKTDDTGAIAVSDGNPVWIYDDEKNKGKEAPVEFGKSLATIQNLTTESIGRKEKLNSLTERYKPLEDAGIEDISSYLTSAATAIDTVANLSDKEILDAGEVDRIKAATSESWEKKLNAAKTAHGTELEARNSTLAQKDGQIRKLIVKSAFDASEFLREQTVLPPDIAYAMFGRSFDVEEVNGELKGFAKTADGDKLMSLVNPGEYAEPGEAIELLIDGYGQKDAIMKRDASGTGTQRTGSDSTDGLQARLEAAQKANDFQEVIKLKQEIHKKKNKK